MQMSKLLAPRPSPTRPAATHEEYRASAQRGATADSFPALPPEQSRPPALELPVAMYSAPRRDKQSAREAGRLGAPHLLERLRHLGPTQRCRPASAQNKVLRRHRKHIVDAVPKRT